MTELDQFIQAYLNGELNSETLKQFEQRLEQDPALLREWAGACFLDHELSKHYKRQAKPKKAPEPAPAMSLEELAKLEEAADAELVHLIDIKGPRISWTHPAVWVPSAAAACALAALIVLLVIQGLIGGIDSQPPTALDNLREPGSHAPAINPTVATLTAEHDAVWKQPGGDHRPGALRQGAQLSAGQRLTLTQGLAEITTHRGAIAIVQAPATVELLDHDNALHLHAGKLVGICETESSKGFLVRTPHMDITDLGTRFGVDATQPDATQVHVIEGMVQVASPAIDSSGPIRLSARQAIRTDSAKVEEVAYTPTGFETDVALARFRPRFEGLAAQWLGRPPADLTLGKQTSQSLQVFTEHRGLVLDRDTAVDFNAENAWPASGIGKHTVAAGTRVDVYLLHLDTPGESGDSFIRSGKYTVHFDRPILGVIGAASSLRATDAILGTKGVSYPVIDPDAEDPKRETASGLDYPGGWSFIDYAEVIDNGTSLHLTLTTGAMMDQVRVLVAADPAGEHP